MFNLYVYSHVQVLNLPMHRQNLQICKNTFSIVKMTQEGNNVIPTFRGRVALPTNSLSCLPVDAVTAISFISFLRPFTPLTSPIFIIFSRTVSAGSKSLKLHNKKTEKELSVLLRCDTVSVGLWFLTIEMAWWSHLLGSFDSLR